MKTSLRTNFKELRKFDKMSRNSILEFQESQLRILLKYSYDHVLYYRELFDRLKITDFSGFRISDLKRIPPLTKDIIKNNELKFRSDEFNKIPKKLHQTGGSTGEPLSIYQDMKSYSYSWPANIRGWQKHGYILGERIMNFGSISLYKKKRSFTSIILHKILQIYPVGGINLNDSKCEEYLSFIKSKKISYLYGYASSIYILAKYIVEHNYKISQIRGVMPTSELCPNHYREMYKKAFGCFICDSYGARDGNIAAFECTKGKFHLNEYAISIIEGNENTGNVLVTDLFNKSMPLINYQVGDVLTISHEKCNCGSEQLIIKELIGRTANIIELGNGRKITGPGWTILFKNKNVKKYRIKKIDEFSIKVDIVKSKGFDDEEKELLFRSFKKEVGDEVDIIFEFYDDFDTTISGKANYFMN